MKYWFSSLALVWATTGVCAEPPVQNSKLNALLFYQLLLGELNVREGEPGSGFAIILDAARKTKDEALFVRATDLALQSRSGEAALQAARSWKTSLPESQEANRYILQILLALNRVEEAGQALKTSLFSLPIQEQSAAIGAIPRVFSRVQDKNFAAKVVEQAIDYEKDYQLEPDFTLRFAALMHDIGKPATRKLEPGGAVSFYHHDVVGAKLAKKRMKELRFDNDTIKAVCSLIELHLRFFGYSDQAWTDAAIRRYVRDAGDQLVRLHILTRADVTTRNQRKADLLSHAYDYLEARIEKVMEQEELNAMRPDLTGEQIMEILGIPAGPGVGKAYKYLLELRIENGPLGLEAAKKALLEWWPKG